jgi:AraC-like DNA-binding protein
MFRRTRPDGQTGWLAGLKDPYVSRALALLHAHLRDPWTVDALGREVGLSRSALADRFIRVIGVLPMQYLTNWRTQVAAQELLNSGKSIPQIADEIGYESEASLTRAFKRLMGVPPATWRRQQKRGTV